MQLAGPYSNNLRSHVTDKGSKSASNQKSPNNPDRHETADRHETDDLGSRFPSNGTAYIYVVLIYAAQKNALVGFHRPRHHQSTTKPWWCLGPRLPQGFCHQGFTKAWPKVKPRTKPWAKPGGLVVWSRNALLRCRTSSGCITISASQRPTCSDARRLARPTCTDVCATS